MKLRYGLIIFLCVVLFLNTGMSQITKDKPSDAVGTITFIKGEISILKGKNRLSPRLGQAVAPGDIISSNSQAKAKVLFNDKKILITVQGGTKIRITNDGAELVSGSKKNFIIKNMESLRPDPKLEERSRKLGGAFIMRAIPAIRTLNLNMTFIRETRPAFQWHCNKNASFLLNLNMIEDNARMKLLWARRTEDQALEFPQSESELERGKMYYWEISAADNNAQLALNSGQFYILSEEENNAFSAELQQLEGMMEDGDTDEITYNILKIGLLNKYHLKDDVKRLASELHSKYPDFDEINKIYKTEQTQ